MALLHEEDDHNHEDKEATKAQSTDKIWNLKRHGEFVFVAKFGNHVFYPLKCDQGGRKCDFVRIQYLATVICFKHLIRLW